jgi:hypothetical protein
VNFATGGAQTFKGLRRRDLVHEVTIDVEEARSIRLLVNQMVFPDFVVERARFHGVNFAQRMDNGMRASNEDAIKGPPAPRPSGGRRTATAIAHGQRGQSAELWKP